MVLLLTHLNIYGKIQASNRSQRTLTRVLEKGGSEKRKNKNDIVEYWVKRMNDELFSCGDNLITRREKRFSCGEKEERRL